MELELEESCLLVLQIIVMASQHPISNVPDNKNDLLYVKRSVRGKGSYCGYKREYLAQNLTELEREMSLCTVCEGIMRKPSFVKEETTCLACSETPNQLNAVKLVENCVNKLEIKCPLLRDCEWKGKLSEAKTHLGECQHFRIECIDCNQVVKRGDMLLHKQNICLMRKATCEYCDKVGKAKDYAEHLESCKKYPIKCPNECGKTVLRMELSYHNTTECPLAEVDCPYAKYGCKANKMKRKYLLAHKKEYIIEHMDMVETENRILRAEMNTMKRLDGLRWEIHNIGEPTYIHPLTSPGFYVNKYKLKCICRKGLNQSLNFTIHRMEGEHDHSLGTAFITEYRVIIPKKNGTQSYYNGNMNYELKIGTVSEVFYLLYFSNLHIYTQDYALTILFYFDVDSGPSISQNFSREETSQPINYDPFKSPTSYVKQKMDIS